MTGALIASDVDLQTDGKQGGYLRAAHSVIRSAPAWLPSPILTASDRVIPGARPPG